MDQNEAWAIFADAQAASWSALSENLGRAREQSPSNPPSKPQILKPEDLNLGARQLEIVRLSGLRSEEGLKTAEIANAIERDDVPNTYMSLKALADRGIVEQIPGRTPQRWRFTRRYRAIRPYPWEDVDLDVIRGRDAEGRYYARCCCDWFSSSLDGQQVVDALRTHVDSCPDAQMADVEQKRILERILSAETIEEMNAIFVEDDEGDDDDASS